MLGGIDPILIFQFYKLSDSQKAALSKVPVLSKLADVLEMPPIPLYLSENLTGLYIDSEEKHIDIETSTETLTDGSDPEVNQKGLNSTISISMIASKNSIGLTLLIAMADLILPKVTSKEYAISYLHGPVVVFGGLLHSFSINQNSSNDLYQIKLELSKANATKSKTKTDAVPDSDRVWPLTYEGPQPKVIGIGAP